MPIARFFQSSWGAQWIRSEGWRGALMQKLKNKPNRASIPSLLAHSLYRLAIRGKWRGNRWFIMALLIKMRKGSGYKGNYSLNLTHWAVGAKEFSDKQLVVTVPLWKRWNLALLMKKGWVCGGKRAHWFIVTVMPHNGWKVSTSCILHQVCLSETCSCALNCYCKRSNLLSDFRQ